MNIIEMAQQEAEEYAAQNSTGEWEVGPAYQDLFNKKFAELVEAAARADERRFIAEKWENWYGYDKEGVAEFIRKRANTQGEQHE
jgi:hypothetical protein